MIRTGPVHWAAYVQLLLCTQLDVCSSVSGSFLQSGCCKFVFIVCIFVPDAFCKIAIHTVHVLPSILIIVAGLME